MKLALVILALTALAVASACGSDDNDNGSATPTSDAIGEPAGQPGPDAPTVSINTSEVTVGDQGEAVLTVLNFNAPGLGAWTVDIRYDNSIVSVVGCEPLPEGNVCNAAYTGDTVRLVGATGTGFEGDTAIGRITFECVVIGESELGISIDLLADGTLGEPQIVVPNIENGAITFTTCDANDDAKESPRIVSTSLGSNDLGVTDSDLKTATNTQGDGTFVYVEQTSFFGVERFVIWLVVDGVAYPLNGATKGVTPELPFPLDADPVVWERTGLSPSDARQALGIVFGTN